MTNKTRLHRNYTTKSDSNIINYDSDKDKLVLLDAPLIFYYIKNKGRVKIKVVFTCELINLTIRNILVVL